MLGFVVWEGSCAGENLLIAAHWASAADWDFLCAGCCGDVCRAGAAAFGQAHSEPLVFLAKA